MTETVRLDDDYNVFYSVVTSASDEAEPFAPSIYQGAAGEAGTAVHNIVAEGETATWANLTRPLPPPPKGKKNKGTPPTPPPPKYTYATNGTWLKASTLSTIGGQTLKELVDAIIATPDGYCATFATTDFESCVTRGQFQSDPLPPPPKGKKGGKDGGKKGGGKNGGGKNGGGKNGGGKNGGGKNGGGKNGGGKNGGGKNGGGKNGGGKNGGGKNGGGKNGGGKNGGGKNGGGKNGGGKNGGGKNGGGKNGGGKNGGGKNGGGKNGGGKNGGGKNGGGKNGGGKNGGGKNGGGKNGGGKNGGGKNGGGKNGGGKNGGGKNGGGKNGGGKNGGGKNGGGKNGGGKNGGGKNGGGKNGGGKNGGGKNGGDSFVAPIAVLEARVNGSDADLSGDVNATGCISLAVFQSATANDYDITYSVRVNLTDSGEPTSIIIKKGADMALAMDTSDATTLTADNGQTYKELVDAMLTAPDAYSALVTKMFEAGAASGAFLKFTKAILAARLNGSNVVGATGDANATGRVCLAVFEKDGDYNVFYSVVTSTSDADEPYAASIYQGAAGEAGTAVHNTVAAGETATWANLTRPPPPPPKSKKNKGTPPPPPPPKYTYGTNATWLTASTVSTIGGQTLKELVDAIIANPDGYFASFATLAFESGAARGQFQSDPLPPPPKGKKGGKDGGKKGGKDGGKNGGGKNGGGKTDGDRFGTLVGAVAARVNGSNVDLQADVNATGCVDLAIFLNALTNDYDIYYHVRVSLNDSGEPTGVVIEIGADVALTVTTSDAKWTNRTLTDAERAKLGGKLSPKGKKGKQPPPPPPPLGYNYETTGTWLSASTLTADNGQTYKELADAMLAAPDAYSALVYTQAFEAGAASGAFANIKLAGGMGTQKGDIGKVFLGRRDITAG
ncbi:unnamed protein product [Closterium sp. Yama58-4]|nr:unnamed protein product [Closterium sp. Yama58-4]